MFSGWLLSALAVGYLGILFAIAFYGDNTRLYPLHPRLRPLIYSLALGVYCSTWTFFGAVGTAVREGWGYLPIYLGPALVFLAGSTALERLAAVGRARNVTSIADFLASRFGKSPALAAIVTVLALTAAVPYLALQYKAVGASVAVLTGAEGGASVPWYRDTALAVALLMALFATLFGTRRVTASEHHEGLMLAIAFESVVKLGAFVAVGVFAWHSLGALPARAPAALATLRGSLDANFVANSVLAAVAVICLPRQFQVGVVECAEPADLRRARWLFPAYLALFSAFVVPIAALGIAAGAATASADTLVLTLPMQRGAPLLALLAFLGGLSAATAMVIVASLALATMITNELLVPALWRTRLIGTLDLGGRVLWWRRATIFGLALLAYSYYRLATTPASLAAIGLLAFAAVAQFAPGIVAGLWWRAASRDGIIWGLIAGFALWAYTLVLPGVLPADATLLSAGPFGIRWLGPQALFGIAGLGPTAQGALWALTANVLLLVTISLRRGTTLQERLAAKAFGTPLLSLPQPGLSHTRVADLEALAARIVGPAAARRMLAAHAEQAQKPLPRAGDAADRGLVQHIERELAGSLGAASARVLLTHALRHKGLDVDEVAELLDETSQELNFSRQLLQATMENVAQGISVVNADMKLVAWNRRYLDMFGYPDGVLYVGRPAADLIRWNALRGECGPGDVDEHVRKRLAHLRSGSHYLIQRDRLNGKVYEIRGQAMPDGGYVTTYTDITDFKNTEQALIEAKQGLETRVAERTHELQAAKRIAEEASVSKTRFVAAASHDLLQPLNAARLFASALVSHPHADPALREIAVRIDSSMRAAEDLLDGLLDVARLDAGALQPELTSFRIADVLADLEQQFAPLAAARKLQLRVVASRAVVLSDRVLLRRILQNYLANALRYTPRGGVVLGCRRRGEQLAICVCDTGPGIAAHHRAAIFGEFTRLERSSPWGEKGLGLGLSICDRIARLLGHALELRSQPGRGSVFGVRVQRSHAPSTAAPHPSPPLDAGAALTGLVALCVDNDATILEGMELLLGRWGVQVFKAESAAEARLRFAAAPVEVVLADYHLGEGPDGLALLGELRQSAQRPLMAALITADYGTELATRARALGYPVLRKPLKPAALRAFLTAVRAGSASAGARAAAG